MSAALQLPSIWAHGTPALTARKNAASENEKRRQGTELPGYDPLPESLRFYRKHTENLLRRYLYASMQVGRAPSLLAESVGRGWASSRSVKTFEDAVIFVLDIERCLGRLDALERKLLARVVLQEYTHEEAATLLGMSVRTLSTRLAQALDHLTELLLRSSLLVLPH